MRSINLDRIRPKFINPISAIEDELKKFNSSRFSVILLRFCPKSFPSPFTINPHRCNGSNLSRTQLPEIDFSSNWAKLVLPLRSLSDLHSTSYTFTNQPSSYPNRNQRSNQGQTSISIFEISTTDAGDVSSDSGHLRRPLGEFPTPLSSMNWSKA